MKNIVSSLLIGLTTLTYNISEAQVNVAAPIIDSIYNNMSIEQKIGQLFMVNAYSGGNKMNDSLITSLIKDYHVGGIIFMQGTAPVQYDLTTKYQSLATTPLMIGMDAEWGTGMRLSGSKDLPKAMTVAATNNPKLNYTLASIIAQQFKDLNMHINFAPDVDVNNNPKNPVINFRSYGDQVSTVNRFSTEYMKGLQDNNIMACAKHFPGHGDVDIDSHLDMPIINKSQSELESLELQPFQHLINQGVASIMIAHLAVPAYENGQKSIPATLSYNIITKLLKEKMGFKGLIISDALDMKGVAKYNKEGEIELKAFQAGTDILLFSQNPIIAIKMIKQAVESGQISMNRLEESVKKILTYKYNYNILTKPHTKNYSPIVTNDEVAIFNKKVYEKAIISYNNNSFYKLLNTSKKINYYSIDIQNDYLWPLIKENNSNISFVKNLNLYLSNTPLIININNLKRYPGQNNLYDIDEDIFNQIKRLSHRNNVYICIMGNLYFVNNLCNAKNIIITHENYPETAISLFEIMTGKHKPSGSLPVTICNN